MNLVSFFHRFLGPPPPETSAPPAATSYPIEERYWSTPIHAFLSSHRFSKRFVSPLPFRAEELSVRLVSGGAHAAGPACATRWLWTAWATVEIGDSSTSLNTLQDFLASHHHWAPAYPGQTQPALRHAHDSAAKPLSIRDLMREALPTEVAHLEAAFDDSVFDQRLAVFAVLRAAGKLPCGEALRSLLDVDPPAGMEAPESWTARWLDGRTYDRWANHGLIYGFTHHSGVVLYRDQTWLGSLCAPRHPVDAAPNQGCYFDLALLVFIGTALAVLMRRTPPSGLATVPAHDHCGASVPGLGELLREPATLVDQGRDLLRVWLRVIQRDLGLALTE